MDLQIILVKCKITGKKKGKTVLLLIQFIIQFYSFSSSIKSPRKPKGRSHISKQTVATGMQSPEAAENPVS